MTSVKRTSNNSTRSDESKKRRRPSEQNINKVHSTGSSLNLSSTESIYQMEDTSDESFIGPFQHLRKQMDYGYHSNYLPQRQAFQDAIITRALHCVEPNATKDTCVVFTAGAMGVGKSHTMKALQSKNLMDLSTFISVDPDEIRYQLPEYNVYNQINPLQAGNLTQKEAGYIAELLILASLESKRNVLVDGTLKDWRWYINYFSTLRQSYPTIKIAILHVDAPKETIIRRVRERGAKIGRIVPMEKLQETLDQVPISMDKLRSQVDFFCTFYNVPEKDTPEIVTKGVTWFSFTRYWKRSLSTKFALQ